MLKGEELLNARLSAYAKRNYDIAPNYILASYNKDATDITNFLFINKRSLLLHYIQKLSSADRHTFYAYEKTLSKQGKPAYHLIGMHL